MPQSAAVVVVVVVVRVVVVVADHSRVAFSKVKENYLVALPQKPSQKKMGGKKSQNLCVILISFLFEIAFYVKCDYNAFTVRDADLRSDYKCLESCAPCQILVAVFGATPPSYSLPVKCCTFAHLL